MENVLVGEFRTEIKMLSSRVVISGDISFDDKLYVVTLHNNKREFKDIDPDKAILSAMSEFMSVEI